MLSSLDWILEAFQFNWSTVLQENVVFKVEAFHVELRELVLKPHSVTVSTAVRVVPCQTFDIIFFVVDF